MPFLPPGMTGMSITLSREQALDVREKCLKSLKDRLIERANIIQVSGAVCGQRECCCRWRCCVCEWCAPGAVHVSTADMCPGSMTRGIAALKLYVAHLQHQIVGTQ